MLIVALAAGLVVVWSLVIAIVFGLAGDAAHGDRHLPTSRAR